MALNAKAQGTGCVYQRIGTVRWRELLDQQLGIEGFAVERAEAAHRPDDIVAIEDVWGDVCIGLRTAKYSTQAVASTRFSFAV